MNIILDNIIFFLQRSGGMSVYWYEIISRFLTYRDAHIKYIEPQGKSENIFYALIRPNLHSKTAREKMSAKLLTFLPYKEEAESRFIFHSSYYRTARSKKAINVLTIHDFIPEYFFHGIHRYIHVIRKKRAIQRADGIICISQNTREDLLRFYPEFQAKPIRVIYNGVSNDYFQLRDKTSVVAEKPEGGKNILFVGKRPPYKNFEFAIEIVASLQHYHFVIAGDKLTPRELKSLTKIHGRYTLVEHPSNAELNKLYNKSHCLLYPSSYEGFGIPVIEAMRSGCPVVALNASAISEIANSAALLSKKLDVQEFCKIIDSLENNSIRCEIVRRGIENANRFAWDSTFYELISFYESLYQNRE